MNEAIIAAAVFFALAMLVRLVRPLHMRLLQRGVNIYGTPFSKENSRRQVETAFRILLAGGIISLVAAGGLAIG